MAATPVILITPTLYLGKVNLGSNADGYNKRTVEQGENIYDFALNAYGSAESVLAVLRENKLTSLNTLAPVGAVLNVLPVSIENQKALNANADVLKQFNAKKISINTGI